MGGTHGIYEKRKEFTNLLQVAINGEADESQDQLRDFWEQFRDLHRRPVEKGQVVQSPSVSSTHDSYGSFSDSLSGWAMSILKSLTGTSGPTIVSGSGTSRAGNGT
jgi:hypothetical protein